MAASHSEHEDGHGAGARAVELDEEDPLPAAELHHAAVDMEKMMEVCAKARRDCG
jgi:hypothetical protein